VWLWSAIESWLSRDFCTRFFSAVVKIEQVMRVRPVGRQNWRGETLKFTHCITTRLSTWCPNNPSDNTGTETSGECSVDKVGALGIGKGEDGIAKFGQNEVHGYVLYDSFGRR
jgi:hypothetical protein